MPPAGPTPIPYPNVEIAARNAPAESGDYLLTSLQHAARDSSQSGASQTDGDFLFGGAGGDSATYFNGLVSRFSAGQRDAYEGAHGLYQDVVVPTGQISDGTSNTIMFAEQLHAPAHDDFAF